MPIDKFHFAVQRLGYFQAADQHFVRATQSDASSGLRFAEEADAPH
jgi:hypothetical protein